MGFILGSRGEIACSAKRDEEVPNRARFTSSCEFGRIPCQIDMEGCVTKLISSEELSSVIEKVVPGITRRTKSEDSGPQRPEEPTPNSEAISLPA